MRKILSVTFVLFVGICLVSSTAFAGVGTTGAQFLKITPGARPMGMGGAYSAVSGDSNGICYNPAGLADMEVKEIGVTYLQHFEGVNAGLISAVIPMEFGILGGGLNYLSVVDIEKRTEDTDEPSGTFGATDMMLTVSYAKQDLVMEGISCGANLKIIMQTIDDQSANSFAIDLGGLYPLNEKLSLAGNLQNIGTGVQFDQVSDPLPMNLKLGVAYRPTDNILVVSDIDAGLADQATYLSLGGEYLLNEMFAFRLGYKAGYDTASLGSIVGVALGVGFTTETFGIDLAFVPFGDLGNTLRLSFNMKFE